MELSIRAQALSLLTALAGGVGLGALYDLLRPLRRRGGDALWDLLFCVCAAGLAFVFAMRADSGALGTGELLLCLCGLLVYLDRLSPLCLPIFERSASKIGVIWINAQILAKKVSSSAKKLFQNPQE